ncbi:23S rRNA Um-2552 2'-O-methyltransferase [Marinobacterium iners DSM 11526]|uniref:Ribosomal RNA large subunit methyltransferase E n=2 Tax=Marinobacterium iners TaxID=48076 RepID=A0A1H4GHP1_9GAMM|nr:23S rRNA Um-2552 2'-O-methyltransferase [Marinobacterium iners DSM 11526]
MAPTGCETYNQVLIFRWFATRMARSKSSARWLDEHVNDPFVKQAQKDGYRSRASYKLLAINEKDKLIRPGMLVIDLGSAPGGWSQVASKLVGTGGKVIASDILPMDSLPDVEFIQGDFTEDSVFEQILHAINDNPVDVVISDMAPNLSGIATADQAASIYLIELALDMAQQVLKPKGSFIAKAFQGEGYEAFVKEVRNHFDTVVIRKPEASRSRSREVYVVGKGFRG